MKRSSWFWEKVNRVFGGIFIIALIGGLALGVALTLKDSLENFLHSRRLFNSASKSFTVNVEDITENWRFFLDQAIVKEKEDEISNKNILENFRKIDTEYFSNMDTSLNIFDKSYPKD